MPTATRPAPLTSERPRLAPLFCPRCQRANPSDASFCYFDGVNLRGTGTGLVGTTDLGRDFIFPSGRRCRTFDQLVQSCSEDWASAKNILRQGSLRQFLASIGRLDLAVATDRATEHIDIDLGLDQLLGQFPVSEETRPKLDLAPRRLHLPALHAGETREFTLTVVNQGARLLHGDLKIECEPWLKMAGKAGTNGNGQAAIKTGKKQQFTFEINTTGLPAGQRYAGKLTLLTNGGVAEVPISVDVAPVPFPMPPLAGASTPRELAAGMKEVPKQVYPLLESGAIRQWFQQNGWQYPVTERETTGIAAVQQFFEALGLSKPPPLAPEPAQITVKAMPGPVQRCELTLASNVKKWLYARAQADKSWVRVVEPETTGPQKVTIPLELETRGLTPGKSHEATISVEANGGQRFQIPLSLELDQPRFSLGRSLLGPVLLGLFSGLLIRLAILPVDLIARGGAESAGGYVSRFSFMLAWVGAVVLAYSVWRRKESQLIPAGLIVGGLLGLAFSATLANLVLVVDGLAPRLAPGIPSQAAALVAWAALGLAAVLLLRVAGSWGREVLCGWSATLRGALGRVGLAPLGNWLEV